MSFLKIFRKKKRSKDKTIYFFLFFCILLSIFFFVSTYIQHNKLQYISYHLNNTTQKIHSLFPDTVLDKTLRETQLSLVEIYKKGGSVLRFSEDFFSDPLSTISINTHGKTDIHKVASGVSINMKQQQVLSVAHAFEDMSASYFAKLSTGELLPLAIKKTDKEKDLVLLVIDKEATRPPSNILLAQDISQEVYVFGTSLGSYFQKGILEQSKNSLRVNVSVQKGDSGAPVVDKLGSLVGVVQGLDTDTGNTVIIGRGKIVEFLNKKVPNK